MSKKPTNTEPTRPHKPTPVGKAFDTVRRLSRERDEAAAKAAKKAELNTRDRYAKRIAAAIDGCEDPEALNRLMQAMEDAKDPEPAVPKWAAAEPEPLRVQEVERG